MDQDEPEQAGVLLKESLHLFWELKDQRNMAYGLEGLAASAPQGMWGRGSVKLLSHTSGGRSEV